MGRLAGCRLLEDPTLGAPPVSRSGPITMLWGYDHNLELGFGYGGRAPSLCTHCARAQAAVATRSSA